MRTNNMRRNIVLSAALVAFFTLALFIMYKTNVFGKFTPNEPFVKGDAVDSNVVVTPIRQNSGSSAIGWRYETGSGAAPCDPIVPTCEGKKGSKTNPFVFLEIVANKSDQQLSYIGMDENDSYPLDVMQIGIDVAKSSNKTYTPGSSAPMDNDKLKQLGQWFSNYKYQVVKIGTKDDSREGMTFAEIGKIYSLSFDNDDLTKLGIDPAQFTNQFNTNKRQVCSQDKVDIEGLAKKYPAVFKEDDKGNPIRDIAINDYRNWVSKNDRIEYTVNDSSGVVTESDFDTLTISQLAAKYTDMFGKIPEKVIADAANWTRENGVRKVGGNDVKGGYLVYVGKGNGDYEIDNMYYANLSKVPGAANSAWIYVGDQDGLPKNSFDLSKKYQQYNVLGQAPENLMNGYISIGSGFINLNTIEVESCVFKYSKVGYSFEYYGVKHNNILKRSLFCFKDKTECDNFNIKVITLTPSEVNAICAKDTDTTVDIIERADLFYIACYDDNTYNIDNVHNLYNTYIAKSDDEKIDASKMRTFRDDDLDGLPTYKILHRLLNNRNLALDITQKFGDIVAKGDGEVPMYQTAANPKRMMNSTLSNLAKLYIISTQFDLTAKKSSDDTFESTFYDDYFLTGAIKQIFLDNGGINQEIEPALTTTAFYKRPKLATDVDIKEAEKAYYMWNMLTFFPADMEDVFTNSDQIKTDEETIKRFKKKGFIEFYFSSSGGTANKVFTEAGQLTHQQGSDGYTGNVAIPHRQGDPNYSTWLGVTEATNSGDDFLNGHILDLYNIMNNSPDYVMSQLVKILKYPKEYEKISDNSALVDFVPSSAKKMDDSKTSFLKIEANVNGNDQDGILTRIRLVNEDGDVAEGCGRLALYKNPECTEEWDKETIDGVKGVKIPMDNALIGYVKYPLKQWGKGYNIVEVQTVGRLFSKKKKTVIVGDKETTELTISDRALFNLE